jgi:hypothetical protein
MKIVEIPDGLTYQEKLNFLNGKKKFKKIKKIDIKKLVGETEFFLIYKEDGVLRIESKNYVLYDDFSDLEKDDLVEAFDIVNIVNRNQEIEFSIIQDIDFFQCIIK